MFIRDELLKTNFILKGIFKRFNECVILYLNADIFKRKVDVIMVFTYNAAESSPFMLWRTMVCFY